MKLLGVSTEEAEKLRDVEETVECESQSPSREWRDRLQSSTDSSLLGAGSVDDPYYSWDSEKTDSHSVFHTSNEGVSGLPVSEVSTKGLPTSSERKCDVEDEDPEVKDLDTMSEISEGDISQAGSNSSLSSMADQKSVNQQGSTRSKRRTNQRYHLKLSLILPTMNTLLNAYMGIKFTWISQDSLYIKYSAADKR